MSRLTKVERHIEKEYKRAAKGVVQKWQDYMTKANAEIAELEKQYQDAKASGDKKLIKKIGIRLSQEKRKRTLQNAYYQQLVDGIAKQIAHVNEMAVAYINGQLPPVYLDNFNAVTKEAGQYNINFALRDAHTVRNLMTNLPQGSFDVKKDIRWNKKKINSAVLQGILQGESIPKIAERLAPIYNGNMKSAIRNVRTLMTAAENGGRYDAYRRARDMGIDLTIEWAATLDNRTRHTHRQMHGQRTTVDDPFVVDGIEIMYPGAGGENIPQELLWNCRCSLLAWVEGFEHDTLTDSDKMTMDFDDWLDVEEGEEEFLPILSQYEKGRNINMQWQRKYANG